ncbi:hypothetical protein [Deinococcus pimensis]|uniref:hypothetical protein n=1 Tax=Deinococcus pimensis TaxID=309888 RepID=UPI0004864069|nr:hypothetical protein [Deinococcus pimensis]
MSPHTDKVRETPHVPKWYASHFLLALDADGCLYSTSIDREGVTDVFVRVHERAGRDVVRVTVDEAVERIRPKPPVLPALPLGAMRQPSLFDLGGEA